MASLNNARYRARVNQVMRECWECDQEECTESCAEMVQLELDEIIDDIRRERLNG